MSADDTVDPEGSLQVSGPGLNLVKLSLDYVSVSSRCPEDSVKSSSLSSKRYYCQRGEWT